MNFDVFTALCLPFFIFNQHMGFKDFLFFFT